MLTNLFKFLIRKFDSKKKQSYVPFSTGKFVRIKVMAATPHPRFPTFIPWYKSIIGQEIVVKEHNHESEYFDYFDEQNDSLSILKTDAIKLHEYKT